jgi:hypothetical protein
LAAGRREEQRKGAVAHKDSGRSLSTMMGMAAPSPSGTGRGKDRGGAQVGGGEGRRAAARRKGKEDEDWRGAVGGGAHGEERALG